MERWLLFVALSIPTLASANPVQTTSSVAPAGRDSLALSGSGEALPTLRVQAILKRTRPGSADGLGSSAASMDETESIEGFLHRRLVVDEVGRRAFVLRWSSLVLRSAEPDAPHQAAFVEAPLLAMYDAAGALVDVDFADEVPAATRELIHRVVAMLGVEGPSTPATNWRTKVRSPRREQEVRFSVEPGTKGTLRLRRELVLQAKLDQRAGHELRYEVRSSTGRIEWRTDGTGLVSAAIDDVVDVHYKGAKAAREQLVLRVERASAPAAVALPTRYEDAIEAVHGERAKRLRFYRMSSDEVAAVRTLDVEGALRAFLAKVDETPSDATFVLKNFVRLHPEASRGVARALNALAPTAANRPRIGFGYSALAAAGHLEAQAALALVLEGTAFNAMNKDRAARSTLSLQQPEPFMAKALWAYRETLPARTLKQREDRGIITNIYGALGGVEHGEPKLTREVLDTLLAEYRRESDPVRASAFLPALGNTGDFEELWPVFEPLFASPETVVRRRAYYVFSKATTEAAFALFAERYARETETTVRLEAVAIAAAMPRTPARLRWAREHAKPTADSVSLGRLVRMLGDELASSPENHAVLQALLDGPIDDEVRRAIYRYVAPLAKGGK